MKSFLVIVVLIGAVILGAVVFSQNSGPASRSDAPGTEEGASLGRAPSFTLSDYEGAQVSMSDFSGKIAVINSWAVWCPFCKDELEDFALLQEAFPDDIAVVAIDRAESKEKAKEFSDSIGVTDRMTFLLDPGDTFYTSIGGFSMPETIFVDRAGEIRIHKRGPIQFDEMRELVESLL